MAGRYLVELADWLRSAGVAVVEMPGWQRASRSSGGFAPERPWCVMWHHTASRATPANDSYFICHGSSVAPIANILLTRDGTAYVCAAGATNTNGRGKALSFSRGTVPTDAMNTYAVGIEMANDGLGETWPQAQIDSAFKISNTICQHLGLLVTDIATHTEYAYPRKIDPAKAQSVAGPWQPRSINANGSWSLADIRTEAVRRSTITQPPPPVFADDEDSMLDKVLVPTGPWAKSHYPYLACFDSGAVRPLVSNDMEPRSGKGNVVDEGQYKRLCDWAKIGLET